MYRYLFRVFLRLIFCGILICLSHNVSIAQTIEGFVFVDSNNNSIMDADEKGLNDVMVSNQKEVVKTDAQGHFQIKLIEGNFVFVTKPQSYQFKLDAYNNPEFYFLYKTKEIAEKLRYSGSEPITKIPKVLYFPLYENPGEDEYSCLLIGDPQMKDDRMLGYYRDGVIPYLAKSKSDFYIILGDIADNFLWILPKERKITSQLGIPGYRVFGNHDMNYKATKNKNASETFKATFGPEYYSFDFGSLHYIILNSVLYDGWKTDTYRAGKYSGGLTKSQLKWLLNDLKLTPTNRTIVLLSHIPMHEIFIEKKTMQTLFKALKNFDKIFAVSGHLHSIIAYDYTTEDGWDYASNFEGLVAGAACGDWWKGPMDEKGVPYSISRDGSPKGFFKMNVKNVDYNYVFHSVNKPANLQLRPYVVEDEIIINWFVGKSTDSVWVYLDNNPEAINLQNYLGRDPMAVSNLIKRKGEDANVEKVSQTAHLWKAKLPEELSPGYHSIKIHAKDSQGKLFEGYKAFYIDKK